MFDLEKLNDENYKEVVANFIDIYSKSPMFKKVQLYKFMEEGVAQYNKIEELKNTVAKYWHDVSFTIISDDFIILKGKPSKDSTEYWYKPIVNNKNNNDCTDTFDSAIVLGLMIKYEANIRGLDIVLRSMNMDIKEADDDYYFNNISTNELEVIHNGLNPADAWVKLLDKCRKANPDKEYILSDIKEKYVLLKKAE